MPNPLETRHPLLVRLDALARYKAWRFSGARSPYLFVTEYPKSGGTWFCQMLAACLDIPFPRHESIPWFRRRPAVLHGHFDWKPWLPRTFCVLRDGRDVAVSAYHYLVFHLQNTPVGRRARACLSPANPEDLRTNLPDFIDYLFRECPVGGKWLTWRGVHWGRFVESFVGRRACIVKYEDLLSDGAATLDACLRDALRVHAERDHLQQVVDRFSFARLTGRKPGEEDRHSFLRKGIAGAWRDHFSLEARRVFQRHAGEALILTGYEQDDSWVSETLESDRNRAA